MNTLVITYNGRAFIARKFLFTAYRDEGRTSVIFGPQPVVIAERELLRNISGNNLIESVDFIVKNRIFAFLENERLLHPDPSEITLDDAELGYAKLKIGPHMLENIRKNSHGRY